MINEAPIYTLRDISLTFGVKPLFTSVSLNICKGDKICLVGRNGSGKSTLLKIISGVIEPDNGEVFVQPGVKVSYMAQEADFSAYETLKDVILSGLETAHPKEQSYKADILIGQLDINADATPQTASGGECKKAALARALISEPDILLLDEPTNHFDPETQNIIGENFQNFEGTLILVSHNPAFVESIGITRMLVLPEGKILNYSKELLNYYYYLNTDLV